MIALNDAIDRGDVVGFRRFITGMDDDALALLWIRMVRQHRSELASIARQHLVERDIPVSATSNRENVRMGPRPGGHNQVGQN